MGGSGRGGRGAHEHDAVARLAAHAGLLRPHAPKGVGALHLVRHREALRLALGLRVHEAQPEGDHEHAVEEQHQDDDVPHDADARVRVQHQRRHAVHLRRLVVGVLLRVHLRPAPPSAAAPPSAPAPSRPAAPRPEHHGRGPRRPPRSGQHSTAGRERTDWMAVVDRPSSDHHTEPLASLGAAPLPLLIATRAPKRRKLSARRICDAVSPTGALARHLCKPSVSADRAEENRSLSRDPHGRPPRAIAAAAAACSRPHLRRLGRTREGSGAGRQGARDAPRISERGIHP